MEDKTIAVAARLARGDALIGLYTMCENQKSVSTQKLEGMLDDISDYLKDQAVQLRESWDVRSK